MPSIARKNLFEDIPRFLVAQAGIIFSVSLVTIQTGVFRGFMQSASLLVDKSSADLWITSKDFVHMELTLPLPYERVVEVRQAKGVDRAEAVMLSKALWRDPTGKLDTVSVVGTHPGATLLQPWNVTRDEIQDLKQPYQVLVDRSSLSKLNLADPDSVGTVSGLPAEVTGLTRRTQSVVFSPFVFASLETAKAYLTNNRQGLVDCQVGDSGEISCAQTTNGSNVAPQAIADSSDSAETSDNSAQSEATEAPPPLRKLNLADPVTFILVRAEPGVSLAQLQTQLTELVPEGRVYTRKQLAASAQAFWRDRTGVGFVLALGAVVGIIVGVAIVGQILYTLTSDRIREFGTLKAMGASDWTLRKIVIEQALWMGLCGYLPGVGLSAGVAAWAMAEAGVIIAISPLSIVITFGGTILMCVGSALFAIQKINRVDPAIVFKA
ncbi:MAG: ABC transporter permease [Cyanophyceae cyanobacterium]